MKHFIMAIALMGLAFSSLNAQTLNTQNVREHVGVSPDSRNADVITFLSFTMVLNGENITRINGSNTADWTKTITLDGSLFRPWGLIDLGWGLAFQGTVGGEDGHVVVTDYNCNPFWSRRYDMEIDEMILSIQDNILLSTVQQGNNFQEYLLVEIDPGNGQIIRHERTGLIDFPSGQGKVKTLVHNGVWYMAIVDINGAVISITNDVQLIPDQVHIHNSGQLGNMNIRELRRSAQGDFYVTGVDTNNDQFFVGKMSINQFFSNMRTIKFNNPNFEHSLALHGPVSTGSPNRVPIYHGGSWGSITMTPQYEVFNFVGLLQEMNPHFGRALMIQYDVNWNLNYARLYNYNAGVGQPNLVKRYNDQLSMVTTLDNGSSSRLIENRLADDFIGCLSTYTDIEENELEISNEQIPHSIEPGEVASESKDADVNTQSINSIGVCPGNKSGDDALEGGLNGQIAISAFPNPSNGSFTLEGVTDYEISIFDLQGRLLREIPASPARQIELSGFTPGSYLVKARSGNKVQTLKMIVQ